VFGSGGKGGKDAVARQTAFLLTTLYDNSSDWRETKTPAILFVELVFKVHIEFTIMSSLFK